MSKPAVSIFGGGPSGLMAADVLSAQGFGVTVFEAMPTVGRKFLLAGKSGLNITHAEEMSLFLGRFGTAENRLADAIRRFDPQALREWADELGAETFVGTSGRVFPKAMKASPLLRAWLAKLSRQGVIVRKRHRWLDFSGNRHQVATPDGTVEIKADVALLAFGGGSWPKLGSDAGWVEAIAAHGTGIRPFEPANCGFDVNWSPYFADHFAGEPVKSVIASSKAGSVQGEFVISSSGIEGSLVYAHASALRDELRETGQAILRLDLAPGRSRERLIADLSRQKGKLSLSSRLRKGAGLDPVKGALLRTIFPDLGEASPDTLASHIKGAPLKLARPRPLAEAISSAGGIVWEEIDASYMLRKHPGVFVAGEMVDWEAPTGGYLLTACLAMGRAAGEGMAQYISST